MNATHAISLIYDKLMAWGRALVLMLPNLIIAILVVIVFSLLARFIGQGVRKVFFKVFHKKEAIAVLISKTTSLAVVLVGLLTALSILDLDKTVTSLLAGVGVIGLALGFAFQDIASNFMSGILISVQHPCEVGDLIKTVEDLSRGRLSPRHLRERAFDLRRFVLVYCTRRLTTCEYSPLPARVSARKRK